MEGRMKKISRVLTIAGSDSGGGAGIQADLKTFNEIGVYGMSVLTSITAQNTRGVFGIFDLPPEFVKLQLEVVLDDIGVDVIKTGMLSRKEIIEVVADTLMKYEIEKVVVDPVMKAKSGDSLLREDAQEALVEKILPLSFLVTPNIPEAEVLSSIEIKNEKDMEEAAKIIYKKGAKNVLIKGGHMRKELATDLLYDGEDFFSYEAPFIRTKNTHGTGCTYASAIAAYLAKGISLTEAIKKAKEFVTSAIKNSLPLGEGKGPVSHFFLFKR